MGAVERRNGVAGWTPVQQLERFNENLNNTCHRVLILMLVFTEKNLQLNRFLKLSELRLRFEFFYVKEQDKEWIAGLGKKTQYIFNCVVTRVQNELNIGSLRVEDILQGSRCRDLTPYHYYSLKKCNLSLEIIQACAKEVYLNNLFDNLQQSLSIVKSWSSAKDLPFEFSFQTEADKKEADKAESEGDKKEEIKTEEKKTEIVKKEEAN